MYCYRSRGWLKGWGRKLFCIKASDKMNEWMTWLWKMNHKLLSMYQIPNFEWGSLHPQNECSRHHNTGKNICLAIEVIRPQNIMFECIIVVRLHVFGHATLHTEIIPYCRHSAANHSRISERENSQMISANFWAFRPLLPCQFNLHNLHFPLSSFASWVILPIPPQCEHYFILN